MEAIWWEIQFILIMQDVLFYFKYLKQCKGNSIYLLSVFETNNKFIGNRILNTNALYVFL